jgi:hypothetical protein
MTDANEIVYLLGAGVNQSVKDWDDLRPPMIGDLFRVALKKRKFSDDYYTKRIQIVYDYVEKYWKKTRSDLANSRFDLEECFTLLEKQAEQAYQQKKEKEYRELMIVQFRLKSFLAEVLSEFETFAVTSQTMRNFGRVLFHENPIILTFNYDCLTEEIIELASGVKLSIPEEVMEWKGIFEKREVPDEIVAYSHFNWNRPLGYGITFDEVQLHQAGVGTYVDGKRFYSHPENKLYEWQLLKLHGSLNWFRYLPIRRFPTLPDETAPTLGEKEDDILLIRGHWWFGEPPEHSGWYIDPIIITPVLYKDKFINQYPFRQIWEKAKAALASCKKLVTIGYSFSPSDFTTKQLLLESLSTNDIQELVVVNPDVNVLELAKDLCHFDKGIIWYKSLEEYLQSFPETVVSEREPPELLLKDIPADISPHDLYAKCKTCSIEFPVGIRTNPRSFATSTYIGNAHQCPNGHINSYDKRDYFLKKVEQA